MEQSNRGKDLRQYVQVVLHRWQLALSVALISMTLGALYIFHLPPVYEAVSLIVLQRTSGALVSSPILNTQAPQRMAVETATTLVDSNVVASEVARRLNSKRRKDPKRKGLATPLTVLEVRKALKGEGVQPDQVFIRARSYDPNRAILIANEAAHVFIDLRERDARSTAQGRYETITKWLDRLEKDSRRLNEQMAGFIREALVFGDEDVQERVKALMELKRARDDAAAAMEAAKAGLTALRERLRREGKVDYFKIRQQDPSLIKLQEAVDELEIRYIKAQAEYQPGADELLSLKEQLDEARRRVQQARKERLIEVTQAEPNPDYQELRKAVIETQAQALLSESRYRRLDKAFEEEMKSLGDLAGKIQKLSDLREQGAAYTQMRTLLLSKKLDTEIEVGTPQKQVTIGDLALTAEVVAPRRLQLLLAAFILALTVGVGTTLVTDFFTELLVKVSTSDDLTKATGLSSLGFIPDMGRVEDERQLITFHDPHAPASEAYRTLRSMLRYATLDKPIRTLLVTSASAGEGKTITAANLAVSIAETGRRVILLDADLRRPTQHVLFGKDRSEGLTTVLTGDLEPSAALLKTEVENLMLLPSGPIPPNPAELLETPQMEQTLQRLAEMCEIVIVDLPPVLAVTDACALTSKTDAVLLVVMAGKLPANPITQAVRTLQYARGKILGAVLNRVKPTPGGPYHYHYYYYYGEDSRRRRKSHRKKDLSRKD